METAKEKNLEIERRWLLKKENFTPGFQILDFNSTNIKQWYITTNPVLRLRSHDDMEFIFCVKTLGEQGKNKGVPEQETSLLREEFDNLFSMVKKKRPISKQRYFVPIHDDFIAEVDFMLDFYDKLIFIEVEFPDKESADNFVPPNWFGENEVTGVNGYSNSTLYTLMPEK